MHRRTAASLARPGAATAHDASRHLPAGAGLGHPDGGCRGRAHGRRFTVAHALADPTYALSSLLQARGNGGALSPENVRGGARARSGGGRVRSLDGLRGVAALVVVVHHSFLTGAILARVNSGAVPASVHGWAWWLSYTPLHLVWAGPEAVYVFFVLSGFVLVLPTESPRFRWPSYYGRRLLRLYLPVVAAVLFAWLAVLLVPAKVIPGASVWLNQHHLHITIGRVLHDMALLHGVSLLNGPLWSLKWEVIFSLLLPLYVVIARVSPGALWLKAFVLLALVAFGERAVQSEGVFYLPIFGLGVLLATHRDWFRQVATRVPRAAWVALSALAVVALTASWSGEALLHERAPRSEFVALEVLAAALTVFIFAYGARARRFAEHRVIQWLGTISFSLYLVHEPIVVSTAHLLGGHASPLLTLAIAVPASLAIAQLFYRCMEGPSHRISQAVGRLIDGWLTVRIVLVLSET